jgi:hypothetical protein
MISYSSLTILQAAVGSVFGAALYCLIVFAVDAARSRGWARAGAALAVSILALLLLPVAASQFLRLAGKVEWDPQTLAPALLAFVFRPAFYAAAGGAIAAFILLSALRDPPEEPEAAAATD